jgi:transcription initiation factor TFIID subunit 10
LVLTAWLRKRLVALAAQKFIADVSNDAAQYSKLRQSKEKSKSKDLALKMEDLSQALLEYGVNVSKPQYFADSTDSTAANSHQ